LEEIKKLSVVDFFCGAGGFSEGFRQLGFNIVRGYDNWLPAIETYNHNFNLKSEKQDILNFNNIEEIEHIPNTEVIIGSPPCVSFSSSNKSGKSDKQSGLKLIKTYLKIVAVKKFQKGSILKAWFMENVPNSKKYLPASYTFEDLELSEWALINNHKPTDVAIVLKDNQHIINSANYGSFQARKRVISGEIISLGRLPIPIETHTASLENNDTQMSEWRKLGDLLNLIPSPNSNPENYDLIQDPIYSDISIPIKFLTDQFYDSGLYWSEWNKSYEQKTDHPYMGKMSFPENMNNPSRTITATKSGSSRESLIYKSEFSRTGDGEYRTPTVREAASIMGFPYTYQFKGSVFNKWRLVGNAVCPAVSRAFAAELLISLGLDIPQALVLNKEVILEQIPNLNDFKAKVFDNPPIKVKDSKFRKHLFKSGNMTVTLANYDIVKKGQVGTSWKTSIEYGTGYDAEMQLVPDCFYKQIEDKIKSFQNGEKFIEKINNGFSGKIASATTMQEMYEKQESVSSYLEPTKLILEARKIISETLTEQVDFTQENLEIFRHKKTVPVSQLFALYALNKISTIANGD
jgi:DNA (cytosine-5)-methyltransferase 1